MDTANLIEEAERWAKNVSESPGNGTAGEDLYGAKLLCDLAAALKASEERARKAEKTQEQLYDEWREELRVSERDRDALAAANLAANKRIVELEHERDAALLAAQGARRTAFNAEQKAKALDAVQRDTIARLEAQVKELRAELARLTTPRPIAEAPRDGTWVLCKSSAGWKEGQFCGVNFDPPTCLGWFGRDNRELRRVTDYLPLPEVKP